MNTTLEGLTIKDRPKRAIMDMRETAPDLDAGKVLVLVRKEIRECAGCGGSGIGLSGLECGRCLRFRVILKVAAK